MLPKALMRKTTEPSPFPACRQAAATHWISCPEKMSMLSTSHTSKNKYWFILFWKIHTTRKRPKDLKHTLAKSRDPDILDGSHTSNEVVNIVVLHNVVNNVVDCTTNHLPINLKAQFATIHYQFSSFAINRVMIIKTMLTSRKMLQSERLETKHPSLDRTWCRKKW